MENWKIYKLEDLIEVKHGFAFKGEFFSDKPSSSILLTPGNFKIGGGFKSDKLRYYIGICPKEYVLKKNDIIVTMTDLSKAGDTLGYAAKIPSHEGIKYLHNQRIGLVKFKSTVVAEDFIYWLLRTNEYQNYVLGSATGSTVKHTSPSRICSYKFSAPINKQEQQRIAKILSSLDDKIELNRRMNATLEAMAKTLFKAWFVDFEPVRANLENRPSESASPEIAKLFPDEFDGNLPKGWKYIKLEELIEIKHGYAFNGEFITDKETEKVLLTPGNFKIGGGFNSSKFKYFSSQFPESYILERNDLIVSMTDLSRNGDTLGYSALVPQIQGKKLLHNQRLGKVLIKSDLPMKLYLYLVMQQHQYKEFVLGSATGSAVRHTSPKRICDYKIILPSKEILSEFDKLIKNLFLKEQENSFENNQLAQIRDSLLPRLIAGKISVGAAEKVL